MYKNIYIEDRYSDEPLIHLWDSEQGYVNFRHEKHVYVRSSNGDYTSLYGEQLEKVPSSYIDRSTEKRLEQKYGKGRAVYQSDLRLETSVLSEIYRDSETPSDDASVIFFDIEVSMEGSLPKVDQAQNPITSVAYTVRETDESKVLIWDPDDNLEQMKEDGVHVIPFTEEDEMLYYLVEDWRDIDPDIISGWNSDYFDVPYLYRRIRRTINEEVANRLSPIGKVDYRKNRDRFIIAGVSSLDYLSLYKNFTFTEHDSYALDNVSKAELDRGKIEYQGKEVEYEGETKVIQDLDDLRKYDVEGFIEYNMGDVWLVRDLDRKFDYIELARKICHMGRVPYEDIYMSSRYIDGAFITRLNDKGIVAPNVRRITNFKIDGYHTPGSKEIELKKEIHEDVPKRGTLGIRVSTATKKKIDYKAVEGNRFILSNPIDFEIESDYGIGLEFEGAYVKEPVPGVYEWIYDLDLTSMYPSIIMSLNISPETLVGKVYDWDSTEFVKDKNSENTYEVWEFNEARMKTLSRDGLKQHLEENNYSIAANGAFYRNDIRGLIPSILEEWFSLRQEYKATRNKWRHSDDEGSDEKAEFYDKLQHVHKILINSVYGVLGLPSFRFYNIYNAEAVTATGQLLIKFTQKMGDHYYNKKINGAKYEVELESGETIVFNSGEMVTVLRDGSEKEVEVTDLQESDSILV